MIQMQCFRVFQLFAPEVKHLYEKNTWKDSQIIFIQSKWFKTLNNFGKEFASERVEAAYIARTDFFIYSYSLLKNQRLTVIGSCNSSRYERFMWEKFFKKEMVKPIPRNSMTNERLGNTDWSTFS